MEEENSQAEEALFENLIPSRQQFQVHNTTPGQESDQIATLNAAAKRIIYNRINVNTHTASAEVVPRISVPVVCKR